MGFTNGPKLHDKLNERRPHSAKLNMFITATRITIRSIADTTLKDHETSNTLL